MYSVTFSNESSKPYVLTIGVAKEAVGAKPLVPPYGCLCCDKMTFSGELKTLLLLTVGAGVANVANPAEGGPRIQSLTVAPFVWCAPMKFSMGPIAVSILGTPKQ